MAPSGNVVQDVVVGTRPRRFAATPDGKELWVSTELSGEVYIIDRESFTVQGKIEFLPPGMRKSDVTPVDLRITRDGKTAYVTLGHAARVAVDDVATRKILSYILVGKRSWGLGLSRDEKTLYERLRRRRHHHRPQHPQCHHIDSCRPHSLGGRHRRLIASVRPQERAIWEGDVRPRGPFSLGGSPATHVLTVARCSRFLLGMVL
jgi:hypothetical protein